MRDAAFASVAVGFFDGVHRGHQAILKGADLALTFENHPLSVLAPERAPRLVMSWEERAKAIMALGVKVTAVEFDSEFASYSPERFLEFLKDFAACQGLDRAASLAVRCGANWRFGKDGVGNADWLRAHGIAVTVVPAVDYDGAPISSTRIRAALEAGEIDRANAMLGRPFTLCGRRFEGKGAGASLGYPTLNVRPEGLPSPTRVKLPLGVYGVTVAGARAIANYGLAPTFGDRAWTEPVLEVHFRGTVPDFVDGAFVEVAFERFVRPERTFASVAELRAQIAADCAKIDL